jgi:hypothetical protein
MEVSRKSMVALALSSMLVLALAGPVAAQPDRTALVTDIPVTGTLEDGGTFEGLLTITNVALNQAGELVVGGVLNGVATPVVGDAVNIVNQAFNVVADLSGAGQGPGGQGRCQILFLDLGPIFLDVLGLEVSLSQIELDITAVSGPGNLLGNLLCAVAGLLDGGPGNLLNNLLRNINRILG